MHPRRLLPLAAGVASVALVVAGCARSPRAAASSGSSSKAGGGLSPKTVVAEVGGERITLAEVDQKAAQGLAAARQAEYEARRGAIDDLVAEKLLEAEARRRGLTIDALLRQEVDEKADPAQGKEVLDLYESNKARFPGRPREQVLDELSRAVRRRNLQKRQAAFQEELRSKASVAVHFDAPRYEIEVPAGSPALGPASAPVTIVEFADYQCPYCQAAESTVAELVREYKGKVRLVHQDFPLPNHGRAFAAARASRCAGEQGRFWDYRKGLLSHPGDFSDGELQRRAQELSLDAQAFGTCLQSDRHDAAIEESLDQGRKAGVTATPTFFVNGRMQTGAPPIEEFRRLVDEELVRRGA
jgi:protein-disulfide isomerase